MPSQVPIVIIGAGIAGLACGRELQRQGREFIICEATARVGGRLGSVVVDGIVCDLGFQVSMSNYRVLETLVDRDALERRPFVAGSIVWTGRGRIRIVDPKRHPLGALQPLLKGLVGWRDLRAANRCRRLAARSAALEESSESAMEIIRRTGFSDRFIESFLRPFFGGVFLDESLSVPSARFLRTLDRFAAGNAEIPNGGMQAIAEQLAEPIRRHIRLHSPVAESTEGTVILSNGEAISSAGVVMATPFDITAKLIGGSAPPPGQWSGTNAVHFETGTPAITEPIIVLNGSGTGGINLLCSPSGVAPGIAPRGRHSLLVSMRPSVGDADPPIDVDAIRLEAATILGVDSTDWRHLTTCSVPEALPRNVRREFLSDIPDGVQVAGDWLGDPSIDGAIQSGIDAARRCLSAEPRSHS
jgi:phytoene dehydrogenase-like protein